MSPVEFDGGLRHWLHTIARSATVKRYHTENTIKDQSVGEHSFGVYWIAHLLTEDGGGVSRVLALHIMAHDKPEHVTGDMPSPTKQALRASGAMDALENAVYEELKLVLPALTPEEERILKYADNLEGALWCLNEWRRGNRHIGLCLRNYLSYIRKMLDDDSRYRAVQPPYWNKAAEIFSIIQELRHDAE